MLGTEAMGDAMDAPHQGLMFVTPSLQPGGAERVVVNLANGCAGHVPTTIVSLSRPGGALQARILDAVEVVDLGAHRVRASATRLLRLIRTRRPAVVVTSQAHVSILLALLRPLIPPDVRMVARETEIRTGRSLGDRGVRFAHRTCYRAHALVLASSRWMAVDLARRRHGPIAILPNPVDEAGLRTNAADVPTPAERSEAGAAGRRFIHVGRLVPEKRIDDVIDAFVAGGRAQDRLLLVGDGPERRRLSERIDALGFAGRIRLVGFDPSPERRIARSDLLILASASEGMPNAVLESLAVGTPVLATTDLVTLDDLAASTPDGALRIVPRAALATAVAGFTPLPSAVRGLRPSLLPEEHRQETVVRQFLELVHSGGRAPGRRA